MALRLPAADGAGQLDRAGVEQQLLGQRRLAGVGVRDDREGAAAADFGGQPGVDSAGRREGWSVGGHASGYRAGRLRVESTTICAVPSARFRARRAAPRRRARRGVLPGRVRPGDGPADQPRLDDAARHPDLRPGLPSLPARALAVAAGRDRRGRASGRDVDRQHRRHSPHRLSAEAAARRACPIRCSTSAPGCSLCYVLQGVFGALLVRQVTADLTLQVLGAALFVQTPALLHRFGHTALCAHWTLLAAIWIAGDRRPRLPLAPRGVAGVVRGRRRDSAVPGGDGRADGTGRCGERRLGRGADRASCRSSPGPAPPPSSPSPSSCSGLSGYFLLGAGDQLRPRGRRLLLDEPAVAGDRHRLLRPAAGDSHRHARASTRAWSTSAPAGWRWLRPRWSSARGAASCCRRCGSAGSWSAGCCCWRSARW